MRPKFLLRYKILINNKIEEKEIICNSPKEVKQKTINICVCVKSLENKSEIKSIEVLKLTHEHTFDLKELENLITELEVKPQKIENPFAYLKEFIPQNNDQG